MLFSLEMMLGENSSDPPVVPVALRNFSRSGCGTIVGFREIPCVRMRITRRSDDIGGCRTCEAGSTPERVLDR
jgi:hypothetical protein